MFNLFRKKDPSLPSFEILEGHELRDKYFARCARWDWLTPKQSHVFDMSQPRLITMDEMPQLVFLEATGERTIKEFVLSLAGQYKREVPPRLDEAVLHEIQGLVHLGVAKLSAERSPLPYYFAGPVQEQDRKRAHDEMARDGLVLPEPPH